jgi:MFS family permease
LLAAAALIALFQSWLWLQNSSFILSVAVAAIAAGLLVAAFAPRSLLSRIVRHVWTPPRREGETEGHYRVRIAVIWLAVAAVACAALYFLPVQENGHQDELRNQYIFWPLALLAFWSLLMAAQSFAMAYQGRRTHDTPDKPQERAREG